MCVFSHERDGDGVGVPRALETLESALFQSEQHDSFKTFIRSVVRGEKSFASLMRRAFKYEAIDQATRLSHSKVIPAVQSAKEVPSCQFVLWLGLQFSLNSGQGFLNLTGSFLDRS